MDWTQRLNASLDYLEDTWDREPDLEKAASLANCSLFHFLRMFEVVTGMGPSEYSRRRRLSRASVDLAAGSDKVIDVALRYGYETPEAFAKAFKRLFGLTPSEAKVPGTVLKTWPPLRLAVVLQGSQPLRYRIVEAPDLLVTGWTLRTGCEGGRNFREIPQFWNTLASQGRVEALNPWMGTWGHLGVCCDWTPSREEFTYLVGVVSSAPELPEGTKTVKIPAATYAVFTSVGPMPQAIQDVWLRAFSEWFPTSGFEHTGGIDFEVYPPFPPGDPRWDPDGDQYESEAWVPIRRKP